MSLEYAILSSFLKALLEKLGSPQLLRILRQQQQVEKELKKWQRTLVKLHAVLEDAEPLQLTDKAVRIWLSELKDLAYDVEDILDEFATEAERRSLVLEPAEVGSRDGSSLRNLVHGCTGVLLSNAVFVFKMGSRVRRISSRLEDIASQKNDLELGNGARGDRTRSELCWTRSRERLPTTCLVNEAGVLGRDEDREAVIQLLTRDNYGDFSVVALLGMGGVGKTTLAQLVYNEERVKSGFDLRMWACVSDDFDILRVTRAILETVAPGKSHVYESNLNSLQGRLQEKLTDKKFLLVLDDVWNEDYHFWDLLSSPLRSGAPGCKILVTTRNDGVASIMGTATVYRLKELPYDSCLPLFTQIALGANNFDQQPKLREIGEGIVQKCKGLPLAVKALASLLRGKTSQEEWEDILQSKLWELPEESNTILPALRLSYQYLPSELKRCFAYCAIFPKDYEFNKEEMVLLWMAEGFLECGKGTKRMETLGAKYFDDLLSRSMFQRSSSNLLRFVMHDLINDLAQYVAGEVCFKLEDKVDSRQHIVNERTRYASFIRSRYEAPKRFGVFHKAPSLRTLLPLPVHMEINRPKFFIPKRSTEELLSKLRYLRALSFSGYCISDLPDAICRLKLLRYLNLSHTLIKTLPELMSTLCNLQTLILERCTSLLKLPAGIVSLIRLRHLDISCTPQLNEMPLHMSRMGSLRTLSKFIVGKSAGSRISELRGMLRLRGNLEIRNLQNVVNIFDAGEANLGYKQDLRELVLDWGNDDELHCERDEHLEADVLDILQPHKNLKVLEIRYYAGFRFPNWVGDPSHSKLTRVTLKNCLKCTSLPALGRLPFLEDLCIQGMHCVTSIGLEFYGDDHRSTPFPSLKTLAFNDMAEWEGWCASVVPEENSFQDEFPCLQELHIRNCPKLVRRLPSHIKSLVKLDICNFPSLKCPLPWLPSLQELFLEECSEALVQSLDNLTSLTTLQLRSIFNFLQFPDRLLQCSTALKTLSIVSCNDLTTLRSDGDGMPLRCSIERLELSNCSSLNVLADWCFNTSSLKDLKIKRCPRLVSFPELRFLSKLRQLRIEECEALDCLPDGITILKDAASCSDSSTRVTSSSNFSYLESLEIIKCPSLTSFPRGQLPSSLKVLKVWDCMQLEPVPETLLLSASSLECLSIRKCSNLKVLPECLPSLVHLVELHISYCIGLESFPEKGLPSPNLKRFYVFNCPNLKSLPNDMASLKSLQHLGASNCPGLVSFAPGGLPPNLMSLRISSCENLPILLEWSLHRLKSLKDLAVSGDFPNWVSFPLQCQLPPTLTCLRLGKLHRLESLPVKLRILTSLEVLEISECPKLRSLPKEGLPASLLVLEISDCPILKGRFMNKKGRYSSIITNVPRVEVDELLLQ